MKMSLKNICFFASDDEQATKTKETLEKKYGKTPCNQADVIVALGGDGLMLEVLHKFMGQETPIYGINHGTVGFLMNKENKTDLLEKINKAQKVKLNPLRMEAQTVDTNITTAVAFNEVSILRQSRQTANISIEINEKERMKELACDGVLLSTPAGSTAYNLSAHGPILPIDSKMLALTPICPFRPRRWKGAIIPHNAKVKFSMLNPKKRPVSAVADFTEVRNVLSVSIFEDKTLSANLLFDKDHSLEERILAEQFI